MSGEQLQALILPIAFMAMIYFFLIRPQKKREKEIKIMRDGLKVGDRVVTIGGIRGKIIVAKEDFLTIETSSSKTKIDTTRWAIGSVLNSDEL